MAGLAAKATPGLLLVLPQKEDQRWSRFVSQWLEVLQLTNLSYEGWVRIST